MESIQEDKIARQTLITSWLQESCGLRSFVLQPMPGDASFRRYFRVSLTTQSFVLMDAPHDQDNPRSFIAIANALRKQGLHTPEIIHADVQNGLLLLTDFGDLTYLRALNADNASHLYSRALDSLVLLQGCHDISGYHIPLFTKEFMMTEWAWHKEWFLSHLLKLSMPSAEKNLDDCYQLLVEAAVNQPQVFMHRDYHSANLMVLPDDQVGILDFQDAFIGPVTYDVVSLLRDCYIDWPRDRVIEWAISYLHKLQQANVLVDMDEREFVRLFDWMGMQRHLKALLTFARKEVRDHQSQYLSNIPRTLKYLINVSQRYPEFAVLHDYLRITVQPAFERQYSCEA